MKLLHYLPLKVLDCILKTLRCLALKTTVTQSRDFSQRGNLGERGEGQAGEHPVWQSRYEVGFQPPTFYSWGFSPLHDKSTAYALIRKTPSCNSAIFTWCSVLLDECFREKTAIHVEDVIIYQEPLELVLCSGQSLVLKHNLTGHKHASKQFAFMKQE